MTSKRKDRAIKRTTQFKSDMHRAVAHRKCDASSLRDAMNKIVRRESLPPELRDHKLQGRYPNRKGGDTDCRECHTSNDWLLIYRFPDEDTVIFIRTGTHSDMF